jgi:serine/threonine protein kinase
VIKDLKAGDPASVGPYRLLGRLGAGGMGEVYLAKSPGGRLVAIKLIRPELADERGFRSRFASEISAARNVSGIYTAAVVDADSEAELPWMATVYVPGPSLTDAVEDNGPLPVDSVLALAAGLAEALQAIHRAGLVHRDLKPSNVLLASDGPRVIDFGISLALERSMMTATGMVMGSPGFMSPEQARGQREVGAPSDMFSFGAVLAFAATGNSPFGVGPTPALLYRVVNEPPDLTAVPARLRPLVEACLVKDPSERPTPGDVLDALSDDVVVLTGEWLPPAIAESMSRYSPTMQTPLPPALKDQEPSQAGPGAVAAGSAAAVAGAAVAAAGFGYEPTTLEPVVPASGAADSVSATRVEGGPGPEFPETSVVPASAPFNAARPTVPGGPPSPPGRPPGTLRRWLWPAAAAAAAVIIAVVAVLLVSHSHGAAKVNPTASLAGDTTKPPATPTASKAPAKHPTATPASQPGGTPVTQPTATSSPTSSPTWTSTATSSPTTSPTWSATPTSSPTTSPTTTPTTTTPTQTPTTNPTSAAPATVATPATPASP